MKGYSFLVNLDTLNSVNFDLFSFLNNNKAVKKVFILNHCEKNHLHFLIYVDDSVSYSAFKSMFPFAEHIFSGDNDYFYFTNRDHD